MGLIKFHQTVDPEIYSRILIGNWWTSNFDHIIMNQILPNSEILIANTWLLQIQKSFNFCNHNRHMPDHDHEVSGFDAIV